MNYKVKGKNLCKSLSALSLRQACISSVSSVFYIKRLRSINKNPDSNFLQPLYPIAFVLLLLCTSHNSAYSQYHISPYEIVYEDLRYLQVSGLISTLNLDKIPILNNELLESMEYDRKSDIYKRLNKRQSELFSKIESSYVDVSHGKDFDRFPGRLRKMFNYFSSADSEDSYFYLGGICNVFVRKRTM